MRRWITSVYWSQDISFRPVGAAGCGF
jgi:hypothetical protein